MFPCWFPQTAQDLIDTFSAGASHGEGGDGPSVLCTRSRCAAERTEQQPNLILMSSDDHSRGFSVISRRSLRRPFPVHCWLQMRSFAALKRASAYSSRPVPGLQTCKMGKSPSRLNSVASRCTDTRASRVMIQSNGIPDGRRRL